MDHELEGSVTPAVIQTAPNHWVDHLGSYVLNCNHRITHFVYRRF